MTAIATVACQCEVIAAEEELRWTEYGAALEAALAARGELGKAIEVSDRAFAEAERACERWRRASRALKIAQGGGEQQ